MTASYFPAVLISVVWAISISLGIWALGMLIFTLLAKIAIPIELGDLKRPGPGPAPVLPSPQPH
jgi:hypothetical protein